MNTTRHCSPTPGATPASGAIRRALHAALLLAPAALLGTTASAQTVYWTEAIGFPGTFYIHSQAIGSSTVNTLWTSTTGRISDVTADPAGARLFWTEGTSVFMGNDDGTGVRSLVHSHAQLLQRVDYVDDGTDQWVYWSCPTESKLARTKLSNFATTVINLNYLGFAIDRRASNLHLYTFSGTQIVRSDLAGGSQAVLATLDVGDAPISMVVDETWDCLWMLGRNAQKLQYDTFWIKRMDLVSGTITTRMTSSGGPLLQQLNWQDIAVDCVNNDILWSAQRDDIAWRLFSAPRAEGGATEFHVPNGSIEGVFVDPGTTCPPSDPPSSHKLGLGCILDAASAYEMVPANVATFVQRFLLAGSNYIVDRSAAGTFAPPTFGTSLGLADDATAVINLPFSMPYPGGVTTRLEVCSNGFISPADSNGVGYTPTPTAFLSAAPRWACWHDLAPTPSNNVTYEFVGLQLHVTWNGVPSYGAPGSANTFQFQFDLPTGTVEIYGQAMNAGTDYLLGWSRGGNALDGGSRDLRNGPPIVLPAADVHPLGLVALAEPRLGQTMVLDITHTPNPLLGYCYLSLGQIPGGIDLGFLGAPGCSAYIDLNQVVATQLMFGVTSLSVPIPAQPAFAGLTFYGQSAWFEPTANAFGVVTSNGLELTIQ